MEKKTHLPSDWIMHILSTRPSEQTGRKVDASHSDGKKLVAVKHGYIYISFFILFIFYQAIRKSLQRTFVELTVLEISC